MPDIDTEELAQIAMKKAIKYISMANRNLPIVIIAGVDIKQGEPKANIITNMDNYASTFKLLRSLVDLYEDHDTDINPTK